MLLSHAVLHRKYGSSSKRSCCGWYELAEAAEHLMDDMYERAVAFAILELHSEGNVWLGFVVPCSPLVYMQTTHSD